MASWTNQLVAGTDDPGSHEEESNPQATAADCGSDAPDAPVSNESNKRAYAQFEAGEFGRDGFGRAPNEKQRRAPQEPQERQRLACPFWKTDAVRYSDCFSRKLDRISRVKQHLHRAHTPNFYCQRCFTIFKDETSLESHVLLESCIRSPSAMLYGISRVQQTKLARKSDPKLPEAQQWFAIWDIVAPGRPRPSSPYIDDNLTADCILFQDFSFTQGPDIIARILEEHGLLSETARVDRGEMLRRAIAEGLSLIQQSWVPPSDVDPPSIARRNITQPSGPTKSSALNAMEGVETHLTTGSNTSISTGPW